MRISAREGDKGYSPESFLYHAYIDGKLVDHCVTADEEEGFCLVYQQDSKGNLRINKARDCIYEKMVYGEVTISRDD